MGSRENETFSSTRTSVTGGEYSAKRYRSDIMLRRAVKGLLKLDPKAVIPEMMDLFRRPDVAVWVVWSNVTGEEVGCIYFAPTDDDQVFIHGGFWDKKLAGKKEIMQALCDTREESLVYCPLRCDRKGKLWAWWLRRCLGFEEVPAYDWLEQDECGTFVMEHRRGKCLQQ